MAALNSMVDTLEPADEAAAALVVGVGTGKGYA